MTRRTGSIAGLICGCLVLALGLVVPEAVATPQWTAVKDLSVAGQPSGAAQIAVDPAGNATAVWTRSDGSKYRVQSSRRPVGGSWSTPVDLSASGEDGTVPQVAVDRSGNATAVWLRWDGITQRVQASRRSATGSWTTPTFISGVGVSGDDASAPQVAVDRSGNAVAVWTRYVAPSTRVQSSTRSAAGVWSAPENRSVADGQGSDPKVAFDAAGNATVLWYLHPATGFDTVQVSRRAAGVWSSPLDLSPADGPSYLHQLAVDPAGRATAVWQYDNGTHRIVQSRHQTSSGGGWSAIDDLSASDHDSYDPQVAVDAAGNTTVAWYTDNGVNTLVQATSRPVGGSWSSPVDLSPSGLGAFTPQVDVDPAGNAIAVWTGTDGANFLAYAARRPVGGAWSASVPLSEAGRDASSPQVALDDSGDAAAVWQRFDGTSDRVQAAGLDVAGPVTRMTAPVARSQTATSFTAAWVAKDTWSAVASKDVRYRAAAWNGAFGSLLGWKNATTAGSATFAGRVGRTYCLSARTRDVLGNVGPWSAERCTTTPIDDRTLTAGTGWQRSVGNGYFRRTFTSTSRNGATLTLAGVKAQRLGLLVARGRGNGTVKVLFNGASLGTFSLAGPARKRFVLPVRTFAAARTGTLKVIVVSTGKLVRIDGVYVGR